MSPSFAGDLKASCSSLKSSPSSLGSSNERVRSRSGPAEILLVCRTSSSTTVLRIKDLPNGSWTPDTEAPTLTSGGKG